MPRVINRKFHKDCPFTEKEVMGFYDIVQCECREPLRKSATPLVDSGEPDVRAALYENREKQRDTAERRERKVKKTIGGFDGWK